MSNDRASTLPSSPHRPADGNPLPLCPRCERHHPPDYLHPGDCVGCFRENPPWGRPAITHAIFCRECRAALEGRPSEVREVNEPTYEDGQRIGDSWFFKSITDKREPYHRVDYLGGLLYCSCFGFGKRRYCKHTNRVLEEIE